MNIFSALVGRTGTEDQAYERADAMLKITLMHD